MEENRLNNPGITREVISGTTCGNLEIPIKNINEIKCPICGEFMELCGVDMCCGDGETYKMVMHEQSYCDDYGTPHCRIFGRDKREEQRKIFMRCTNGCVEEMKFNIKDVTLGYYREFNECSY